MTTVHSQVSKTYCQNCILEEKLEKYHFTELKPGKSTPQLTVPQPAQNITSRMAISTNRTKTRTSSWQPVMVRVLSGTDEETNLREYSFALP